MKDEERQHNQSQIENFVSAVFSSKQQMTLSEFILFNTTVTSEMFISVMSVLQERLPCSQCVMRRKRAFKDAQFKQIKESLVSSPQQNSTDTDSLIAKAEEMCLSPMKALPSPKMLQAWQPTKQVSHFKPESPTTPSSAHGKKPSLQTDFKIKKKVGADNTRQQALSNSSRSFQSSELADSDFDQDSNESISRLIESNKMRRLAEARRNWVKNHSESSPFRMSFGSSNSFQSSRNSDNQLTSDFT